MLRKLVAYGFAVGAFAALAIGWLAAGCEKKEPALQTAAPMAQADTPSPQPAVPAAPERSPTTAGEAANADTLGARIQADQGGTVDPPAESSGGLAGKAGDRVY